jgi:hypothetical protein
MLIVALGFFYREPSATGSYCWLPVLLDGNWRTQGTRKQLRTTEIGPSFFFMMYISFAVKIHRSTITTVANIPRRGEKLGGGGGGEGGGQGGKTHVLYLKYLLSEKNSQGRCTWILPTFLFE